jgi:hypothetical protein
MIMVVVSSMAMLVVMETGMVTGTVLGMVLVMGMVMSMGMAMDITGAVAMVNIQKSYYENL